MSSLADPAGVGIVPALAAGMAFVIETVVLLALLLLVWGRPSELVPRQRGGDAAPSKLRQ